MTKKPQTVGIVKKQSGSSKKAQNADTIIDDIELVLELAGMLPAVGTAADFLNAIIKFARGNFLGAILSIGKGVPVVGDGATFIKVTKNSEKYLAAITRLKNTAIKKLPSKYRKDAKKILNDIEKEIKEQLGIENKKKTPSKPKTKRTTKNTSNSKVKKRPPMKCGESGAYAKLLGKNGKNKYDRDHIPSKKALITYARKRHRGLTKKQVNAIIEFAPTIAIPKAAHSSHSPTYGRRNSTTQIKTDAGNLAEAAKKDIKEMRKHIHKYVNSKCKKRYNRAANKILKLTNADYDKFIDSVVSKY